MIINQITAGYVIQSFDTDKNQWVSQEFVAGDIVEFENDNGEHIDQTDFEERIMDTKNSAPSFKMVQPYVKE